MIMALAGLLSILTAPTLVQDDAPRDQVVSGRGAVLRGLDKVSGHTVDIELRTGAMQQVFGLQVALSDCRYPANNPTGDAFAYLTILENGSRTTEFEGWMIASTPALNALDHSRYDVWVLRCITS
jgi:hypothetical protein